MRQPEWHEMGFLREVTERSLDDGDGKLVIDISLTFDTGSATFTAMAENDTLRLSSPTPVKDPYEMAMPSSSRNISANEPWSWAVGLRVLWGRQMENHHGFVDGYQLEFATGDGAVGRCVDLVVVASTLHATSVAFH